MIKKNLNKGLRRGKNRKECIQEALGGRTFYQLTQTEVTGGLAHEELRQHGRGNVWSYLSDTALFTLDWPHIHCVAKEDLDLLMLLLLPPQS